MLLKQLPENIFGNTVPGCGCYNGPRCLVSAAFRNLSKYDGGGAPPVAVQHAQHSQPLANGLWCAGAAESALSGRHKASPRYNLEQFGSEPLDLRLLHRWNRMIIGADGERGFVWPAVRATSFRVPTKGNKLA